MLNKALIFGILVNVGFMVGQVGCRPPKSGVLSELVNCGSEQVQKDWHKLLPKVTNCLLPSVSDDATDDQKFASIAGCVDLAVEATHTTIDTAACIIKGKGEEAATAAAGNPDDVVSMRLKSSADIWLSTKKAKFVE